jgi:DNA-binding PadR family transcriptional regulator
MLERELLLLGFLRREQAHGYRLNEFIEHEMTTCTDIKKPTAYFLLDKMAKQGWLTKRETREGNRPPRQVYRLTAKGEAQYQKLLRENLGSFLAAKFPGDVGLAYADDLEPQEVLSLLAERRTALLAELDEIRQAPQHAGSLQLIVDHQVRHLEAELAWLDQVIAQFKKKARQG